MKKIGKFLLVVLISTCVTSCFSCSEEKPNSYQVSFRGKAAQKCYHCTNGNGRCTRCGGKGVISDGVSYYNACPTCKGTGNCKYCGGNGILNN